MHAADRTAGNDARQDDAPPRDFGTGADNVEGEQEDQDGHEERGDSNADGVRDLQLRLVVMESNRTVSDVVLWQTEVAALGQCSLAGWSEMKSDNEKRTMHQIATPPMVME